MLKTTKRVPITREAAATCETWTDVIRFVDVSEGSSSSVLKTLQLSERRKQHKTKWRHH